MTGPPIQRPSQMDISRWLLIGSLYVSQYVGQAFLLISLITIMRRQGLPMEKLGLVYSLALCWVFKFVWSPVIDRYNPICGRYKGWILITQLGMALSLLALSLCRLPTDFYLSLGLGCFHSFFSSTQDVASDGLCRTLLLPGERPAGMSVQAFSGLLGNIIGGGVVLAAFPGLGWSGCCLLLAGVIMVSFFQCLFLNDPPRRTAYSVIPMNRLIDFWKINNNLSWLAFLVPYSIGIGLGWGLLPVLLADLKWGFGQIGFTLNVAGSLTGMIGAALSGLILKRIGRARMLKLTSAVVILGLLAISAIVGSTADKGKVFLVVQIYFLCVSPCVVVIPTLMMDRSSADSPATDYSVQFCLATLCQYLAASVGTMAGPRLGFGLAFLFCALVGTLTLLFGLKCIHKGVLVLKAAE
ncbi:MAG: MFS transporter [Deltaproteobacteria bacterium]|nr:MFS transporter [Deltaproteobacteria bacterium]